MKLRARELSEFIGSAAEKYHFDPANLIAVGYSNGANIAAAVLLLHPGSLSRAALFRAMVPIEPDEAPDLSGTSVFIAAGRKDPIIPPREAERLARLLRGYGVQISLHWTDAGHRLAAEDIQAARTWLEKVG